MKRKLLCCLLFAALFSIQLHSQVSTDPDSGFYIALQKWEMHGLVDTLPMLRPYPFAVIKDILTQVIEKGNERDAEAAKYYWETFTGKPWQIEVEADLDIKAGSNVASSYPLFSLYPSIEGDACLFNDLLSAGYHLGLSVW